MSRNPIFNALAASGYIVLVVSVINYLSSQLRDTPDTVLAPMLMISLFTLSAAVMGYIFLSNPLQLFLDGKRKEAVNLFIETVGVFAVITSIILIAVLARLFS